MQGHCIHMYLLRRGCICLSPSERMICPSPENTRCAQTAGKWEHAFSSNFEPPLESDAEFSASLSPPVMTLKTAGRAEENHLPVRSLSSLIGRRTFTRPLLNPAFFFFHNRCSLFPLIVSVLNLFVCVHTLATQIFFCQSNQAMRGNLI